MTDLIEIKVPSDDKEGTESMVGNWFKKPGDFVSVHEPLLEINTDKVNLEVAAPIAGVLSEILKPEGTPVAPGEVLGLIKAGASQTASCPAPAIATPAANGKPQINTLPFEKRLSPAVKCLLKKHALSPEHITGSGKGGRITHRDVKHYIDSRSVTTSVLRQQKSVVAPGQKIPHSPMRKKIASHMVESMLHTAPHVTTVFEADCSRILAHRKSFKETFAAEGTKLTLTCYFIKAAATALLAVPEVNSRWHDDGLELLSDCNIGVGTALEEAGLVVPVLHRVQNLDLKGIARELQQLISRAREGKLTRAEMEQGTFTISNHGTSGSLVATPIIINQPQSAILGIGKLEKRFKIEEINGSDAAVIRPCCYVTLTIDHRVLDGFTANKFMQVFVDTIQNWPLH